MSGRTGSVVLLLLSLLLFAEFFSWHTASWSGPCLVLDAYGAGTPGCPVFHEGVGILIQRSFAFVDQNEKGIVALFTIVLAISTIGLWLATRALWNAGERQIGVLEGAIDAGERQIRVLEGARQASQIQFLATHRPRIRVKHLCLDSDIWHGQPIVVDLWLVNNGDTDAFIYQVGVRYHVVRNDRLLPIEPEIPHWRQFDRLQLSNGLNLSITGIDIGRILTPDENTTIQQGEAKLYCVGYVGYLDVIGEKRLTGFCRVLKFPRDTTARTDNSRFLTYRDPDYEYQD